MVSSFQLSGNETIDVLAQQYIITVELSPFQIGVARGDLVLKLHSNDGKVESILVNQKSKELLPFKTYQYLISLPNDFEITPSVALRFEQESKFFGLFKSSKVPVISKVMLKTMKIG